MSWHYPISPKNRYTSCNPCPAWLQRGSEQEKDPLRIWFYPQ
ncbi:transcriptional regulator [Salmonella enterica]|nr:transcriptional regulator [Salmonella enterica]EBZ6049808.1 transcriptional regulator [Salmonella enterica subsp. enterica serovar Texas]EAO4397777.1 transcriptional regulator [Salmonella enterica]EAQ6074784.1 transcriptional regulator [Salmonella enterica]EAT1310894.1 transcriptional regulator [Salmonella enterica]